MLPSFHIRVFQSIFFNYKPQPTQNQTQTTTNQLKPTVTQPRGFLTNLVILTTMFIQQVKTACT